MTNLPDWAKRTIRTFLQAFVGVLLLGWAAAGTFAEIADLALLERAAVAGIIATVTAGQTYLEDRAGKRLLG